MVAIIRKLRVDRDATPEKYNENFGVSSEDLSSGNKFNESQDRHGPSP
jgi:hypothetical protein